jgi:hypothetical protein
VILVKHFLLPHPQPPRPPQTPVSPLSPPPHAIPEPRSQPVSKKKFKKNLKNRAEVLKLQKSGQFPDDLVKIESAQIQNVSSQMYYQ